MVKIIDRRSKALGGQNNTRSKSAIKEIAWHYTATTNSGIDNHERYWRNNRGWTYGGYHFYIDRDGNVYQNYNLETISNGVKGHNSRIINICCEASRADNYTQAQLNARHELTLKLMGELNISADKVKQHGEFSGQSTDCAGYTKAQMNEFRSQLKSGKSKPVTPAQSKPAPKPTPKPTKSSWKKKDGNWTGNVLREWDYGSQVKQLQELLASNNFYPEKGAKNNGIDSYYGAKTKNAVERYQSVNGLVVDGIAGKATYNKLKGSKPAPKPQHKPTSAWTGQVLRQGARGDAVEQLQRMLSAKYFYPKKGAVNKGIDGIYGAKTADAVRRFQTMNGLTADGIAGPATYKKLK